jgi:thymidylate kinase
MRSLVNLMLSFRTAPDSGLRRPPNIIFLTGVDGSGKSLLAGRLIEELQKEGLPVRHLWYRFNNIVSKPLLAFCRLIGLNHYKILSGTKIGYHDFEKSKIISWCFIICQLIDIWIVTLYKIWPQIITNNILVCDRGTYDTLVDVMVDTKNRSLCCSIIGKAFLLLLPRQRKIFYLQRNNKLIFKSRPDVSVDKNFDLRCELYQDCAKRFNWLTVNNDGSLVKTLNQILNDLLI